MGLPTELKLDSWRAGDAAVVAAHGDIDLVTSASLEAALDTARDGADAVVLDLRGVEFMDTSGLRVVFEQRERARASGGRFAVVRGPHTVQRLFEIVGLPPDDTLFVADPDEIAR